MTRRMNISFAGIAVLIALLVLYAFMISWRTPTYVAPGSEVRQEFEPVKASAVADTEPTAVRDFLYEGDWTTTASSYVPKDLDDASNVLVRTLKPDIADDIRRSSDSSMASYHFSLGLTVRNQWKLWNGSRLAHYFESHGVTDADDMSAQILQGVWRKLHAETAETTGSLDWH